MILNNLHVVLPYGPTPPCSEINPSWQVDQHFTRLSEVMITFSIASCCGISCSSVFQRKKTYRRMIKAIQATNEYVMLFLRKRNSNTHPNLNIFNSHIFLFFEFPQNSHPKTEPWEKSSLLSLLSSWSFSQGADTFGIDAPRMAEMPWQKSQSHIPPKPSKTGGWSYPMIPLRHP